MCVCNIYIYIFSVPTLSLCPFHFISPPLSLSSSPLREFCIPQPPGMFYMYNMLHVYMCMYTALYAYICTHGTVLYNAVYIYSGGRGAMRYCICIMLCTFTISIYTSDIYYQTSGSAVPMGTVLHYAASVSA